MAKKPIKRAPEGEFERLSDTNSFRIPIETGTKKLPVDIGIELPDGRMQILVKHGKPIPFKHHEMYSTAAAYQTAVEMHFLMGNRPLAKDNLTIGRVKLRNIRWSNQGIPALDILVEFDGSSLAIGSNNLDRTKDKGAVVCNLGKIDRTDIDELLDSARSNAETDEEWRNLIRQTDEGRLLINELADAYALAKRSLSFSQKREHNKVVNRVCKTLNSPLQKLDAESITQFRADMEILNRTLPYLNRLNA